MLNFCKRQFPHVYHSCNTDSKTKGVSILIEGSIPWQVIEQWAGADGRMLFVKGKIGLQLWTLASLYSTNINLVRFLELALEQLQDVTEGTLILGATLI